MRRDVSSKADGACASVAEIVTTLARSMSLEVLGVLAAQGETAVTALADALELDKCSVSKSLRFLHSKGMLQVRASGNERWYCLSDALRATEESPMRLEITASDGCRVTLELHRSRCANLQVHGV